MLAEPGIVEVVAGLAKKVGRNRTISMWSGRSRKVSPSVFSEKF